MASIDPKTMKGSGFWLEKCELFNLCACQSEHFKVNIKVLISWTHSCPYFAFNCEKSGHEEGPRAARRAVQGGGMSRVRLRHRARYQAPEGRLLCPALGRGMLRPVHPLAAHCAAGSAMRGVRWRSGREHVPQVRDGRGVPPVPVDPQQGGTRRARLTV